MIERISFFLLCEQGFYNDMYFDLFNILAWILMSDMLKDISSGGVRC